MLYFRNNYIQTLIATVLIVFSLNSEDMLAQSKLKRKEKTVQVEDTPNLTIKEGFVCKTKKQRVKVVRNGRVIAVIKLSSPVVVAQADKKEEWGFFQFPSIYKYQNDPLIVGWQMAPDSPKAYGNSGHGRMMSKNKGKTWKPLDKDYFQKEGHRVDMKNGDVIHISTLSKDIKTYSSFPKPINTVAINNYYYYRESELPDELQGVYLYHRIASLNKSKQIHGKLNDPGLLRYSIDNLMPIVWWGDIRENFDGSLIAGVYPTIYADRDGTVKNYGVSFYKTTDTGYNWDIIGKIPYQDDSHFYRSSIDEGMKGFSEPAFLILKDSSFLCVMRTGSDTPMYKSQSKDGGKTWSNAVPFTPNGVAPKLLQLDNGIIVLSSGRPGVQLRFCIEGDGICWTEPIDMIPFLDDQGKYTMTLRKMPTCGYTDIMAVNDNTFYMVYSDFNHMTKEGVGRKAILFRKIEVDRRY